MMADFVTPRHSAVMERLRRRIELFRQHHNSCERRYEAAALESLELERQQTLALHQRCLQAKAKRSNKHRQPPASAGEQAGQRAPGAAGGGGGGGGVGATGAELGDGSGVAAEQSRNSTLIALQETVKRKLESAGSPLGREQVNGFSDGFPHSKKACMDATAKANGSPMDSKLGLGDALASNGTHGPAIELAADGAKEAAVADFHRKEMKQEPDDILPIMPPSAGGNNNNLFPDLNLDEQEWSDLMEELNCTVPYEDIQDILNDGFEDRKDPLEMTPNQGSGGVAGSQSSQSLLPLDLGSVKAEFSPSAFEQDSRTGSPHIRSASSGPPPPPHPTSSPAATSSASSLAAPPPRQHPAPPNHLLTKDLSPAQQLQQLAAQQQRAQQLHSQLQHRQTPPAGAKFHSQGVPHAHPPPWTQMAAPSQSPLGSAFGVDKPATPSLYPQDFNSSTQKQRLMSGQPPKGSPKAGANSYMPGAAGHPGLLSHPAQGPPLNHAPAPGGQAAMLNYNNTKPLSHFEAGPGPPRPANSQNQNKAALLSLLRQQQQQQQQQQMKQKNNMNFRQHLTHSQDQNSYPAPPHGPSPASNLTSAPGGSGMAAPPGPNAMASNHGNTAYLSSQAAALKQQQQQQILDQQKQQYLQRQQMMAEQEKQRQQDQQLQRHLTRPPPQYQDQPGQNANQNAFAQAPVSQFTASSQSLASVSSMGGPAPSSQRMFPQPQGMMGLNMASGAMSAGGAAPPPTVSQVDLGLTSCGGGAGVDVQQVLYNNMTLHPSGGHGSGGHAPQQRQPLYRHTLLSQQHLSKQSNAAAMLKQQQMATTRMPANMQAAQNAVWQQPTPPASAGLPPNAFTNATNAFHMQQQQPRIPKMAATAFNANPTGRPVAGMMQSAQQRAPPNPQNLGPPQTQQQAAQNHPTNQSVLPDLVAFGATASGGRQGLACNQGYQVSRTANQQQLSFGYNATAGSFAAESDLVESLLKGQSAHEWMADLDELLASHQ
ncbi:mastermind-like protein 1 isoform X2 [Hippocampus comes]|uniref:mastermind-like protein 1 isoform X2 n=1 Tax=Hippocampus comes TaxID=109280 RepID=UPI00094E526B|nr:PREDICTED: mastermind-like protein 1 isoform X2 [Hippocampus comes]